MEKVCLSLNKTIKHVLNDALPKYGWVWRGMPVVSATWEGRARGLRIPKLQSKTLS